MYLHRNIRYDLIEKELMASAPYVKFIQFKPTNRVIDRLFRHHSLLEMTEHWYDAELDPPWITDPMEFTTWIDVVGDGIWDYTQKSTEKTAKKILKSVRSNGIPRKDRFYIAFSEDYVYIYWYGRDSIFRDYWWVFERNQKARKHHV